MVNGGIRKDMEAGGPMQVMTGMATWPRDLKLPQYADWEGYHEHLPAYVRRMTYSSFTGAEPLAGRGSKRVSCQEIRDSCVPSRSTSERFHKRSTSMPSSFV